MPDALNLTDGVSATLNGSLLRGRAAAVAYVRPDGRPSVSFRGSVYVRNATEIALWVRKADSGMAAAIAENPAVSLVFFEPPGASDPYFVSVEGRARVAPEYNDEVYAAIVEREREGDPEKAGVAIIVDVDSVMGAGSGGFFQQGRA